MSSTPGNAGNPGNAEPQLGINSSGISPPGINPPGTIPSVKVWYSRGYLPHCDQMGLLQFITFRLADSLPQEKLQQLEEALKEMEDAELGLGVPRVKSNEAESGFGAPGTPGRESFAIEVEKRKRIERWLDAGMGCCALRHPHVAQITQETLVDI